MLMSKINFMLLHLLIVSTGSGLLRAQSITLGAQIWSTKNVDGSTFRNGEPILQAISYLDWKKAGEAQQPAWCYYDNDTSNGTRYGKLYNWYAVADHRGLCPTGWHVPTDEEWSILTDYLGGEELAGAKMKSNYGWKDNEKPESSSGFNGLPGGWRSDFGTFYGIGSSVSWWSSAKYINSTEWERRLSADNPHVYTLDTLSNSYTRGLISSNGLVYRAANNKQNGYSVRCIKD
jgi:uncharacterized protein (TIGR02145 family)